MSADTSNRTLALDAVVPGMSLAEPVLGEGGEVVLAQGAELTEVLLKALRRRGVQSLSVCSADLPIDAALAQAQQVERLARLFRAAAQSSGCTHLYALLVQYRSAGGA